MDEIEKLIGQLERAIARDDSKVGVAVGLSLLRIALTDIHQIAHSLELLAQDRLGRE
jgi:hypothetical protein